MADDTPAPEVDLSGVPIEKMKAFETVYKAGKLPDNMKAAYEKVRPYMQNELTKRNRSFTDVPLEAAENIVPSAINAVNDIYNIFRHPVDTAEGLYHVTVGVGEKVLDALGVTDRGDDEAYAEAMGHALYQRYGSWENVKNTMATDPVGFLTDASTIFSGGEGLAARGLGTASKVTKGLGRIAKETNIGTQLGRGAALTGNVSSEIIGGLGGYGGETLNKAREAGERGAWTPWRTAADKEANKRFNAQLSAKAPRERMVQDAQRARGNMEAEASQQYQRDIAPILNDPTPLSWSRVDQAVADMDKSMGYLGADRSQSTIEIRKQIKDEITFYKGMAQAYPGVGWDNIAAFDNFKKWVGEELLATAPPGTRQEKVASAIYGAAKDTIDAHNSKYAEVTDAYKYALGKIKELNTELSLGKKANTGTALRKLTSVMRNNVNTSWGYRGELVKLVQDAGAPYLLYELAGHDLQTWLPRGLPRYFSGALALEGQEGKPKWWRAAIGAAASPRIMGNVANKVGMAKKYMGPVNRHARELSQLGRAREPEQRAQQKIEQQQRQPIQVHIPVPMGTDETLANPSSIPLQ